MMYRRLKASLKRLPVVYQANARLKAERTARALVRLDRRYERLARDCQIDYCAAEAVRQLRLRLSHRGVAVDPAPKGRLRILWVGGNWDQDNSGFLAGLREFGEVTTFRNARDEYGLGYSEFVRPRRLYDPVPVKLNDACLIEQVQALQRRGGLDVLMGQMWAHLISVETLKRIQAMGVVTVNVSMDDRLPEHWGSYRGIRMGAVGLCDGTDLVLTSSPECCLRFAVEGCPSLFWPMASDPERFKPSGEDTKQYDVSFIGNKYGLRGEIVEGLQRAGIHVDAFGGGWPNGPATADQAGEIFGRSRIILGVGNIGYSKDIFTLKLRDFDATMAGALYVTHRNPDLLKLFEEGKQIECYLTLDECVRKVRYYLDHPEQRMAIAAAAATRARREHTWEHRLSTVFRAIGFLGEGASCLAGVE